MRLAATCSPTRELENMSPVAVNPVAQQDERVLQSSRGLVLRWCSWARFQTGSQVRNDKHARSRAYIRHSALPLRGAVEAVIASSLAR